MTSQPTVHLVDGDAAIRAALTFSLELQNFAVECYPSAEALLDQEQLPQSGCLVLDSRLPGIDGLECLATLRVRGVSLPAIIIASTPTRALRARAAAAGAVIVEKPLLCDGLTAAIQSEIRKGRLAA